MDDEVGKMPASVCDCRGRRGESSCSERVVDAVRATAHVGKTSHHPVKPPIAPGMDARAAPSQTSDDFSP
jgi:hypothetical protein